MAARKAASPAARQYSEPHQFEPLLPQTGLESVRERARRIVEHSLRLSSRAHPATLARLRELLRAMNSYYSNRIEGQGTHPHNIERALKRDFSDKPDIARLQRIALAHIEAEQELEEAVGRGANPLLSEFALKAHAAHYGRLSVADRTTKDGIVVKPGVTRDQLVDVGRHVPPVHEAIPKFFARFDEVYGRSRGHDEELLAIACAHQRLTWVHPFVDGNGRAARLQTHCALWKFTGGLWSPNRGLASRVEDYYARLSDADEPRRGDLDGRGNLSEEGLRRWCDFFLSVCEDQVNYMTGMLDLDGVKTRFEALVTYRSTLDKGIRKQAALPLYHLFAAGPLERGEFQQMTGLGERVARALLSRLLATGLVESDSTYGPVRIGLPLDALQFLFPELYPEAATRPTS